MLVAQSMSGTELVPVLLLCVLVGTMCGVVACVCALGRRAHYRTLFFAVVAVALGAVPMLLVFRSRGYSISRLALGASSLWPGYLSLCVPAMFSATAVLILFCKESNSK